LEQLSIATLLDSAKAKTSRDKVRVLALTTIFPHAENPRAAPYIRQQAVALSRHCRLDMLGVLPWFPAARAVKRFTYWGTDFSTVPREEVIDGLAVRHPRFFHLPRLTALSAATYAASLLPTLAPLRRELDAVYATWAYPDGVAALTLGRLLGLPVVVQVIGSDVNRVAKLPSARRQLRWSLPRAGGVVAVSRPLAEEMVALGAPAERVHVIPTGLDRGVFRVRSRSAARRALGQPEDARLILFVGRLYQAKGVGELLDAFDALAARSNRYRLVVIGDGPARAACEERARRHAGRLLLAGELGAEAIAEWLAACDVLSLPSHDEGTPNVVLEALGCGRKVVATNVGGIPAVVTGPLQGQLVPPRRVPELCAALEHVLDEPYDPEQVAASVELFDWDENARRVLAVLDAAVASGASRS